MNTTIDLTAAEAALLIANEKNDHPGWQPIAAKVRARLNDTEAIAHIALLMSGREWDADTLDGIAEAVRSTGRRVEDSDNYVDTDNDTRVCLACDDEDHQTCYGGPCGCACEGNEV